MNEVVVGPLMHPAPLVAILLRQAYYPCLDATIGRPYPLYVHGNSDPTAAVRAMQTIATGLKWKRLREPVTVIGILDAKDREACWELGATAAASLTD